MSAKRSRVVRSSSSGEIGLLLKPIEPPVARWQKTRATAAAPEKKHPILFPKLAEKNRSVPEQPRRSIFTLGSPDRQENGTGSAKKVDERYQIFFQACFHCKRQIAVDDNVFMYGYLQAFCSLECRDAQIALDEKNRKPSPQPILRHGPAAKVEEQPKPAFFYPRVKNYTIAKFK